MECCENGSRSFNPSTPLLSSVSEANNKNFNVEKRANFGRPIKTLLMAVKTTRLKHPPKYRYREHSLHNLAIGNVQGEMQKKTYTYIQCCKLVQPLQLIFSSNWLCTVYRAPQKGCTLLQEPVPCMKIKRNNQKVVLPKLNRRELFY